MLPAKMSGGQEEGSLSLESQPPQAPCGGHASHKDIPPGSLQEGKIE